MSCSDKKVLVTGATGLIGKELQKPLHDAGFDVYAITIDDNNPDNGIHWLRGNLFDGGFVRECMVSVKPTHLLNMAWATTGDYLSSDINYRFLQAGISLAQSFAEHGGKRAVYAGTCFEYKFKDAPLFETDELEPNKYTYTFCKDILRQVVSRYFHDHGISFGYGRIFYVFGKGEVNTRLTGMLLDKLSRDESVEIKSGNLYKDYIYTKDIAAAFVRFLDSDVTGSVNVCSGQIISIRDYVMKIAKLMGKPKLVRFIDGNIAQPSKILGNNGRLITEIGYKPRWSIDTALKEIVSEYVARA